MAEFITIFFLLIFIDRKIQTFAFVGDVVLSRRAYSRASIVPLPPNIYGHGRIAAIRVTRKPSGLHTQTGNTSSFQTLPKSSRGRFRYSTATDIENSENSNKTKIEDSLTLVANAKSANEAVRKLIFALFFPIFSNPCPIVRS
jgi:hypothetical protein